MKFYGSMLITHSTLQTLHSADTPYAPADGYFISQFLSNQDSNITDNFSDHNVTALDYEIRIDKETGEIVTQHTNGIPLGSAKDVLQSLKTKLEGDSGKMILLNFATSEAFEMEDLDNLFKESGIDHLLNFSKSDIRHYTLGELYDRGDRIFLQYDERNIGDLWYGRWKEHTKVGTSWRARWQFQEVIEDLDKTFDKTNHHAHFVDTSFQVATNMLPFNQGGTQEVINSLVDDLLKTKLKENPHVSGGIVSLDDVHNATELQEMIKEFNETPLAQRDALLDSWEAKSMEEILSDAKNKSYEVTARRLFLGSYLRMKDASMNPLGDLGNFFSRRRKTTQT